MLSNLQEAKVAPLLPDEPPAPAVICAALHEALRTMQWEEVSTRSARSAALQRLRVSDDAAATMKPVVTPVIKAELRRLGAVRHQRPVPASLLRHRRCRTF